MQQFLSLAGLLVLLLCGAAPRAEILPPGVPLGRAILAPMVEDALEARGAGRTMKVTIERPALPLGNPSASPTELRLEAVELDQAGQRFGAALVGTTKGRERFRLPVAGRLIEMVELPVPARRIARGEQISMGDLTWRAFEAPRVRRAVIEDPDALVGQVARRPLRPERQVSERDVAAPQLIERGHPVRLVFQGAGLCLTTLGIAQEPGALGEVVQVRNAASHALLSGIVSAPGVVRIGAGALGGGP